MQLLVLGLFLLLYLHDASALAVDCAGWVVVVGVVGPKLLWTGLYTWACRVTLSRLSQGRAGKHLRRMELVSAVYRVGVLGLFSLDLYLGLLVRVRGWIETATGLEHVVLVDELSVMLPTLVMWGVGWWLFYPIERRLREAALMRNFDRGLPVYPVWSRRQFVLSQYRYQVLLILLPLLGVIAWTEGVGWMVRQQWAWVTDATEPWWTIAGCLAIFVTAPVIIRLAWDTAPLPDGELRDHLMSMCKTHKVRIRELLLWRTYGGMINAAVMGLIGPLRYILITDGLLQQMPTRHVEAVMAHELAHVRKRHMFWLLVTAVGLMGLVEIVAVGVLTGSGLDMLEIEQALSTEDGLGTGWLTGEAGVTLVGTLAGAVWLWAFGFGWVSRRIERQADTFAVAHMVQERGGETIEEPDALAMIHALQHVAELNHVRAEKHSWRHGSIAWRQNYLRSLVGEPIQRLAINRQMRWINVMSLSAVALAVGLHLWLGGA